MDIELLKQIMLWIGGAIGVSVVVAWGLHVVAMNAIEKIRDRHLETHARYEFGIREELKELRYGITQLWDHLTGHQ